MGVYSSHYTSHWIQSPPIPPTPFAGGGNTVFKHTQTVVELDINHISLSISFPTLINRSTIPPLSLPIASNRYVLTRLAALVHRFNISVTSTISSLRTEVTATTINTDDSTSISK